MYPSYVAPWGLSLVLVRRRPDLASEDRVADRGVEQHQWEDEEARAPEHEGQTGMWRWRFFDRDRERDHVRPERDPQRAERGRENERDHSERRPVPMVPNAVGKRSNSSRIAMPASGKKASEA